MELIAKLFGVFLQIGCFSIGGGYAVISLIQNQIVGKYGWLTEKTFGDIITISQMTPGPLAVNASTFAGFQLAGVWGAAAATAGCVAGGIVLSLLLYVFFKKKGNSFYMTHLLKGLKAASTGLILSAAGTILLLTLCIRAVASKDYRSSFYKGEGKGVGPCCVNASHRGGRFFPVPLIQPV